MTRQYGTRAVSQHGRHARDLQVPFHRCAQADPAAGEMLIVGFLPYARRLAGATRGVALGETVGELDWQYERVETSLACGPAVRRLVHQVRLHSDVSAHRGREPPNRSGP